MVNIYDLTAARDRAIACVETFCQFRNEAGWRWQEFQKLSRYGFSGKQPRAAEHPDELTELVGRHREQLWRLEPPFQLADDLAKLMTTNRDVNPTLRKYGFKIFHEAGFAAGNELIRLQDAGGINYVRHFFGCMLPLPAHEWSSHIRQEHAEAIALVNPPQCQYLGDGRLQIGESAPYRLLEPEMCVIEALVELRAADERLLSEKSGVSDPSRVLRRLVDKFPSLQPFVRLPATKGRGGYSTTIIWKKSPS